MQISEDQDGVHKCDHTRNVETKQLNDGIDHTFVSAGGSETLCPSFLLRLCPLDVAVNPAPEPIPKQMDMHLRDGSCHRVFDTFDPMRRVCNRTGIACASWHTAGSATFEHTNDTFFVSLHLIDRTSSR